MIDLNALASAPRLLADAALVPIQSARFQPTGFPDLGAAAFKGPGNVDMLLVESPQSMANRCESACWDDAAADWQEPFRGLPHIAVDIVAGNEQIGRTSSVLEAHRLNSPYVLDGVAEGRRFEEVFLEHTGHKSGRPVDRTRLVMAVLRFDPCALLHGVFMSNLEDGRMRLSRAMSTFIEAREAQIAPSGGVKNDRVNPSGDTAKGFGNVPFARTEYTAKAITAFFNLDVQLLRSYGLPDEAYRLLILIALYKFQKVLRDHLRLRTACDLRVEEVVVTAPSGFALPKLDDLVGELPSAILACKGHFSDPPVTQLRFQMTEAAAKASKKSARGKGKDRDKDTEKEE